MPMYNLIEHSDNYSMSSRSLWNYYRNEVNDDDNENDNANNRINNNKTIISKSFVHNASAHNNTLDSEVVLPLKYFSSFRRFVDLQLISCEIELDLSWSKICIISEILITSRIPANSDANPPAQEVGAIQTTGATFQINNAKLYVPLVTLSINDNIKFLENIKQGPTRHVTSQRRLI